MIGFVVFGIFNDSDSHSGILNGFPEGGAGDAFVFGGRDGGPVGGLEGDEN